MQNKNCLVVGGGNVATRKVKTLLNFGASVCVVADRISDQILLLKEVKTIERKLVLSDLDSADFVFAATDDSDCNTRIALECKQRNIPVNVADSPELCTFLFPATVQRGDLVVGISTGAKCPAVSKMIRKKIDSILPKNLSVLLDKLTNVRKQILDEGESPLSNKDYNKIVQSIQEQL